MLQAGPKRRHWALQCQWIWWHWPAPEHRSASRRLALAGTGHWSAKQILPDAPLLTLKSLGKAPKSCWAAVHKCFNADKSFIIPPNDQIGPFLPSNPSFGTAVTTVTTVTVRHWLALGTPVPAESWHWPALASAVPAPARTLAIGVVVVSVTLQVPVWHCVHAGYGCSAHP